MDKQNRFSEALGILESEQQRDGSFNMLCSIDTDFGRQQSHKNNFVTSIIALALTDVPGAEKIRQKAAAYLQKQIKASGAVNYWPNKSKESRTRPYPDDLDDTFCTYAVLAASGRLVDGKQLAKAVKLLTSLEQKVGGPYKTWVVSKKSSKAWQDVDLAVNANIAHFLKTQGIILPKLRAFFEKKIKENDFSSPYYAGAFPVIYFLARSYDGVLKPDLIKYILSHQKQGDWGGVLNTALAICALRNLGYEGTTLAQGLRKLGQTKLAPEPFHIDLTKDDVKYYAGSKALTSAIVLEALRNTPTARESRISYQERENEVLNAFWKIFAKRKDIQPQLKQELSFVLDSHSKTEIILLPYLFSLSLKNSVPHKKVIALCLVSLLGWMAYRIYDDFLDEEGEPKRLPLANIFLKRLTYILNELELDSEADAIWPEILDRVDYANWLEISRLRSEKPKLSALPKELVIGKSIGHSIGSLLVYHLSLSKSGKNGRRKQVAELGSFFEHYLYARQVSDDLHDWEKDFKQGQLNPVSWWLLRKIGRKYEAKSRGLMLEMREVFLKQGLVYFGKQMLGELAQAKKNLDRLSGLKEKTHLLQLLHSLERVADKCVNEGAQARDFVVEYENA
jgi:hypothetical protein